MKAHEIIKAIEAACCGNLEREVMFHGEVALMVQDEYKSFGVKYSDAACYTNHPNTLSIKLTE